MDAATLDHLIAQCATKPRPDAQRLTAALGPYLHQDFCVRFSKRVALEYLDGRLPFGDADEAMNWLFAYSYVDGDLGMPKFAWQVHDAFDQGEFFHDGDGPDIDPKLKYTRPKLEALFAQARTGLAVAFSEMGDLELPQWGPGSALQFARHIALSYLEERLDYAEANGAMLWLFERAYLESDQGLPELAWECLEAFHRGETRRARDESGLDPRLIYTRPMLADLQRRGALA